MKFPDDIWIVKIWTVKTGLGLRLRLGLGLVMTVQFMNVQILTVQLRHVIREQQPATFRPMSIVVKRLHGLRCHLVWTLEVCVGPDHIVLDGNPAPSHQPPKFRPVSIVAKWLDGSKCHLVRR